MPIHLNPFRLYKGALALDHGLLVEILRSNHRFWEAYADLLAVNSKRESDSKELAHIMRSMKLDPKKRLSAFRDSKKALTEVTTDFERSVADLHEIIKNLKTIVKDDEMFLYRVADDLRKMYIRLGKMPHVPDYLRVPAMHEFRSLIQSLAERQKHVWDVAKAHSRGFVKVSEMTFVTSGGESRRIRRQTIELDHYRNRIEPLAHHVERMDKLTDFLEIHKAHEEMTHLLDLYRREIHDLGLTLHEADILVRRSEGMFRHIEKEAESLGLVRVRSLVQVYSKQFRHILSKLESLARREFLDINGMLKRLPPPPELKEAKAAA